MVVNRLSGRIGRPDLSRRILLDAHEWAMRLVCDVLDMDPDDFGPCLAIGVIVGDRLGAGVVYHDFRTECGDCSMTVGSLSPGWATRGIIAYLLQYPLIELDCRRVSSIVRGDNERALTFNRRLGFVEEGRRREYFADGVDAVIFGMMRQEWAAGPYRWD